MVYSWIHSGEGDRVVRLERVVTGMKKALTAHLSICRWPAWSVLVLLSGFCSRADRGSAGSRSDIDWQIGSPCLGAEPLVSGRQRSCLLYDFRAVPTYNAETFQVLIWGTLVLLDLLISFVLPTERWSLVGRKGKMKCHHWVTHRDGKLLICSGYFRLFFTDIDKNKQ